jgi:hypothetical protein
MEMAVPLAGAIFGFYPPVAIAAMVAAASAPGSWTSYGHLAGNMPADDPKELDDAVYGKPWLLPAIARHEGLGARGGPTLGFRLLRVAYPGMGAVLGMAVLVAGLGFVGFGEAQRLEGLIQDDGPGGDDPGRQFMLEVRRTNRIHCQTTR